MDGFCGSDGESFCGSIQVWLWNTTQIHFQDVPEQVQDGTRNQESELSVAQAIRAVGIALDSLPEGAAWGASSISSGIIVFA